MRRLISIGAVLVSALALSAPAQATCDPLPGWQPQSSDAAAEVLRLLNEHRASIGQPAMRVSATLERAATWKAQHMAALGYMAHNDPAPPIARSWSDRVRACGYFGGGAGENVAYGFSSPASVMAAWLSSPGHRANIERSGFAAIGVGAVRSAEGRWYWAQNFGSTLDTPAPQPAPLPPVCSNAGVPSWYAAWARWRRLGTRFPRPSAPRLIPRWSWQRLTAQIKAGCPA